MKKSIYRVLQAVRSAAMRSASRIANNFLTFLDQCYRSIQKEVEIITYRPTGPISIWYILSKLFCLISIANSKHTFKAREGTGQSWEPRVGIWQPLLKTELTHTQWPRPYYSGSPSRTFQNVVTKHFTLPGHGLSFLGTFSDKQEFPKGFPWSRWLYNRWYCQTET